MGAGISHWKLAREVAIEGQIGTVSGTAIEVIVARTLQMGDPGGYFRKAFEHFPIPEIAELALKQFFIEDGKAPNKRFANIPMYTLSPEKRPRKNELSVAELAILSNFAQVWLAKKEHEGIISVNFLTKIEPPHLFAIFGAILAGVDIITAGAGLPIQFPQIIDGIMEGARVYYKLSIASSSKNPAVISFDPKRFLLGTTRALEKPDFLPIITLPLAGEIILKKTGGKADGFVVEGPKAGGHNASPRGPLKLNELDEPIYGAKDEVDFEKIRKLNKPFWIAGDMATPEKLKEAKELGAEGIQAGSIFAGCASSGFAPEIRKQIFEMVSRENFEVRTSAVASPTGYPIQIAQMPGTLSDPSLYDKRTRVCDLGYLREAYEDPEGKIKFRCPSEPVSNYLKKGGEPEDTEKRMCLCNALLATAGLPQIRTLDGEKRPELPVITFGKIIPSFLIEKNVPYSAREVVDYLLGQK